MQSKTKHKELDNRDKAFIDKAMNNPEELTDEEMDMFLSAMKTESDSNVMKHYNPHR